MKRRPLAALVKSSRPLQRPFRRQHVAGCRGWWDCNGWGRPCGTHKREGRGTGQGEISDERACFARRKLLDHRQRNLHLPKGPIRRGNGLAVPDRCRARSLWPRAIAGVLARYRDPPGVPCRLLTIRPTSGQTGTHGDQAKRHVDDMVDLHVNQMIAIVDANGPPLTG